MTARSVAVQPVGRTAAERTPGFFGRTFDLVKWLLLSLLFSVLLEWGGMTWVWPEQGSNHSRTMLETELGFLASDLRESLLVRDTATYARRFADLSYEGLIRATGIERLLVWLGETPPTDASKVRHGAHALFAGSAEYALAAVTITQLFAVRVAILTLALPVFILAAVLGLADGLVQRDVRRWSGGRESSFVYHHARRLIGPLFLGVWVLYLALPVSLHPGFVVLPFAVSLGLTVAVTAASFKKYL